MKFSDINLKASAIWSGVIAVVAAGGLSVDWIIKKDAELGESQARQDSIVVALTRAETRLKRMERYLGIKPGQKLPDIPEREGIARRIWKKLF